MNVSLRRLNILQNKLPLYSLHLLPSATFVAVNASGRKQLKRALEFIVEHLKGAINIERNFCKRSTGGTVINGRKRGFITDVTQLTFFLNRYGVSRRFIFDQITYPFFHQKLESVRVKDFEAPANRILTKADGGLCATFCRTLIESATA